MTGRLPRDFMKVLRRGRTTVVSIVSDKLLDERTVRRFTERLFILADDAQGRGLHLDLQNVEHVSSLALSNLITVHKRLQYGGGKLTLCNVRPPLAEILRATKLDHVFAIDTQAVEDETGGPVAPLAAGLPMTSETVASVSPESRIVFDLFAQHGFLTQSPLMLPVLHRVARAGQMSDLPVLLLGETGTGKQRLADAIHALDGKRHSNNLITINCGSINRTMAESELFGHVRGAYTGAERARLGVFRAAHGGTLLLDEIGELELDLQPKLLRVLEEHRLLPVGADLEHDVDVRVIAATHRPLEQMVEAKQFRADLYHRLSGYTIRIPPLRERPEDIELQAAHFLTLYAIEDHPPLTGFRPAALDALRRLPWGGNTRQLQNVVRETLVDLPRGPLIELHELPRSVLEHSAGITHDSIVPNLPAVGACTSGAPTTLPVTPFASLAADALHNDTPLQKVVEQFQRELLRAALAQNQGSRTRTAAQYGVSREALRKMMKKFNLD